MSRWNTRVNVADILAKAVGSTDVHAKSTNGEHVDWVAILAAKVSHDHFDVLADTIMREGFRVPITLVESGDGWIIGNGHHRLCAAILLGLDRIPVVITDNAWDWVEDSHDGDYEPGDPSTDYWSLMCDELGHWHGYYGVAHEQDWRAQYGDAYKSCPECGQYGCGGMCADAEPERCWACQGEDIGEYEAHLIGCPERDWEYLYCPHTEADGYPHGGHYRRNACEHLAAQWHAEALAEHMARGYLPVGAWHPVRVLSSAYAAHSVWMRDAHLRAVREAYEHAARELREAIAEGASDWRITDMAEDLVKARKLWICA